MEVKKSIEHTIYPLKLKEICLTSSSSEELRRCVDFRNFNKRYNNYYDGLSQMARAGERFWVRNGIT